MRLLRWVCLPLVAFFISIPIKICFSQEQHVCDVEFPTPIGIVKLDISYDPEKHELVKRGTIDGVKVDEHRTRIDEEYDNVLVYSEHESFGRYAKVECDVAIEKGSNRPIGFRVRVGARNPVTQKFSWSKYAESHFDQVPETPTGTKGDRPGFAKLLKGVNQVAMDQGHGGAIPFFTKNRKGQNELFVIKKRYCEKTDVHAKDLEEYGDVPDGPIGRMILTYRWARDNGYGAGFPDFEQASDEQGEKFGVHWINKDAVADVKYISASDLGNPADFKDCFKAVDNWCEKQHNAKYKTGYPTGEQRNKHGKVYYKVVLLIPEAVEGKAWPDKDVGL